MSEAKYKRVIIKLSGEALAGDKGNGIDEGILDSVVDEIIAVKKLGVETVVFTDEFVKGDSVKIVEGGFADCVGVVEEVYHDTKRLKVLVSMFGRETPVEVAFEQVTPAK
jgi:transcription antitermination factor NusG